MKNELSQQMELGVVIVSYNTRELLRECLASIRSEFDRETDLAALSEVHVVDCASAGRCSPEMVRTDFPWVELHVSEQNLGLYSRK